MRSSSRKELKKVKKKKKVAQLSPGRPSRGARPCQGNDGKTNKDLFQAHTIVTGQKWLCKAVNQNTNEREAK